MRSFVAYRRRVPAWHADVPERHVHDFYRRSYDVIAAIHERLAGDVARTRTCERIRCRWSPICSLSLELEKTEIDSRRAADAAVAATSMTTQRKSVLLVGSRRHAAGPRGGARCRDR